MLMRGVSWWGVFEWSCDRRRRRAQVGPQLWARVGGAWETDGWTNGCHTPHRGCSGVSDGLRVGGLGSQHSSMVVIPQGKVRFLH